MEEIVIPRYHLSYPVGLNMQTAIDFVKQALKATANIEKIHRKGRVNIFCRGSSGAILAALFSAFAPYECFINHIKKSGESSHSLTISSFNPKLPAIIIDDFIGSGQTMREIYKQIATYTSNPFYNIDLLIVSKGYDMNDTHRPVGFVPNYVIQNTDWR